MSETSDASYRGDNEITNPGQDDEDELFRKLKQWAESARDHSHDWRKEAEECYDFVAGEQWSQDDKAVLTDQMRSTDVFNRVDPVIQSVAGYEIQNRQEIRFLPRKMGNAGLADAETAAAKWFRDQSMAEDEESDAFKDCMICGMGWVDTRLDYETDPEGTSVDDRIDPIEMYWDPVAKKKNIEDRRYQCRAKDIAIEEAREEFPDVEDNDLHAGWFSKTPDADDPHRANEAKFYRNDQSGKEAGDRLKKVTIVQFQWWEREQGYLLKDPTTGKVVTMGEDKYAVLVKQAAKIGMPLKGVPTKMRKYYQAFVGAKILEKGDSPYPKGFTINCMTGLRDHNKNTHYGLVRAMIGPQRWSNKFFSTLIHEFATSGKGVMMETDAVPNIRNFEENYSSADKVKWVAPGAISKNKIQPLQGSPPNAAVTGMMEFSISSIRDVTGVNIELMGMAEKDQPGILEFQRKQAGLTILAPLFDSLRRFRKTQGHVLLYYIRTYFSDGRLIRIEEAGAQKYIPLIRDESADTYDIIVDDAPTSPNQKEHVWGMLVQMMDILRGITDPMIWSKLIKYSPLPDSLSSDIAQELLKKASQPPQMAPDKQAELAIKSKTADSTIARNIAGAMRDLAQAGVQAPGPGEEIRKQAVAALLNSGQSAQDHGEQLQQNAQEHAQQMQLAAQAHAHAMQQNQQQAALAPPPTQGA